MPNPRSAALALTLFCFGCAQASGPQYDIGQYQPPPSTAPSTAQPVTFQDTTPSGFETTPAPTLTTAVGGQIDAALATGLAIVGLVVLVALAEGGCAGEGCNPEPAPTN